MNARYALSAVLALSTLVGVTLGSPLPIEAGVNRWTLFGPGAGGLQPLLFVGQTLFGASRGLFKSTDDGETWTYVGHSPEGRVDFALAEPGAEPAGTLIGRTRSGELVLSTDGGASWEVLQRPGKPDWVDCLAFLPTQPATLLISIKNILWRSVDHGAHWSEVVHAPGAISQILTTDHSATILLVTTDALGAAEVLLRSDNGGRTWTTLPGRLKDGRKMSYFVAPIASTHQPGTLYTTVIIPRKFGSTLVKSEDGGWSWVEVSDRVYGPVLVDFGDPSILYSGSIYDDNVFGFWLSRNGGVTWAQKKTNPPKFFGGDDVQPAFFSPHGHALYAGTASHGVAESPDGGKTWKAGEQAGLFSGVWTALQFRPGAPQKVFLALDGLHDSLCSSTDGGATWTPLGQPDRYWGISGLGIDPEDSKLLFAGSVQGIWRSVDGGMTWEHSLNLLNRPLSFAFPEPGVVLVGMDYGVYRSADRGKTWDIVLSGSPDGSPFYFISHLVPDPSQPRTVYAWTEDGDSALLQIWKSSDAGLTWRELPEHAGTLAIDPRQPATLYAVRGYGEEGGSRVVRTTDGGETWTVLPSLGLPTFRVNSLVADPMTSETLYAGTTEGVFRSEDGGTTWKPLAPWGLARRDRKSITLLVAHPTIPHRLYALAEEGGAFEIQLDQ